MQYHRLLFQFVPAIAGAIAFPRKYWYPLLFDHWPCTGSSWFPVTILISMILMTILALFIAASYSVGILSNNMLVWTRPHQLRSALGIHFLHLLRSSERSRSAKFLAYFWKALSFSSSESSSWQLLSSPLSSWFSSSRIIWCFLWYWKASVCATREEEGGGRWWMMRAEWSRWLEIRKTAGHWLFQACFIYSALFLLSLAISAATLSMLYSLHFHLSFLLLIAGHQHQEIGQQPFNTKSKRCYSSQYIHKNNLSYVGTPLMLVVALVNNLKMACNRRCA